LAVACKELCVERNGKKELTLEQPPFFNNPLTYSFMSLNDSSRNNATGAVDSLAAFGNLAILTERSNGVSIRFSSDLFPARVNAFSILLKSRRASKASADKRAVRAECALLRMMISLFNGCIGYIQAYNISKKPS
jgi:hypothetical protein